MAGSSSRASAAIPARRVSPSSSARAAANGWTDRLSPRSSATRTSPPIPPNWSACYAPSSMKPRLKRPDGLASPDRPGVSRLAEKEAHAVTEFKAGDRVRVLDVSGVVLDAGRTGTVVWIRQNAAGAIVLCQVRLDGRGDVSAVFVPHELELESGRTRDRPEGAGP